MGNHRPQGRMKVAKRPHYYLGTRQGMRYIYLEEPPSSSPGGRNTPRGNDTKPREAPCPPSSLAPVLPSVVSWCCSSRLPTFISRAKPMPRRIGPGRNLDTQSACQSSGSSASYSGQSRSANQSNLRATHASRTPRRLRTPCAPAGLPSSRVFPSPLQQPRSCRPKVRKPITAKSVRGRHKIVQYDTSRNNLVIGGRYNFLRLAAATIRSKYRKFLVQPPRTRVLALK